ncbi:MAG: threonine ammonia-lyase IlvA [Bacteroidales bacterium]|nr:threonine ammonia-lyase IlvA [Bacteroidales bacterium]
MKLEAVKKAKHDMEGLVLTTPLQKNINISEYFKATVCLKREDLQTVRSYKIRGAYHKIKNLSQAQAMNGVVCASAGNHAQGVALTCKLLNIRATVLMPITTPSQKVNKVKQFGGEMVDVILYGDTFDQAYDEAVRICKANKAVFIHPFDDEKIIEGQATVGLEIYQAAHQSIDYLFLPIGGGGLASGVSSVFKQLSPNTRLIGVEPKGAASMQAAYKQHKPVRLKQIDRFVDGAAVQEVGKLTFQLCKENLDQIVSVDEGKVCSTLLKLYNEDGIIVEPAGALSIAALEQFKDEIKGKRVVCIVSGSNNDITRMEEIKERAMLYEGLKHYFVVKFPQRAGALKEFVSDVLGPNDDISFFEYSKKTSREKGPATIGLELKSKDDLKAIMAKMKAKDFQFEYINEKQELLALLI